MFSIPMAVPARWAMAERLYAVRSEYGAPTMEPEHATPRRRAATPGGLRPGGRRPAPGVVILGLLIFAAGGAVLLANALIVGAADFIAVASILTVVPLALAGLAWRFGTWATVVATVAAGLGVIGNVPSFVHGLQTPDSFFDFVPSLLALVGGLVALIGGVVTLVRRRRGATPALPRAATVGLVGALGVLAVLSAVLTFAGREDVSASAKAGATPVLVEGGAFKTDRLEVKAGAPARLLVKNEDLGVHSFTIKQLGIDRGLGPASEYIVELPPLEPGTYTFICNVPNHENMKGTLVVTQ